MQFKLYHCVIALFFFLFFLLSKYKRYSGLEELYLNICNCYINHQLTTNTNNLLFYTQHGLFSSVITNTPSCCDACVSVTRHLNQQLIITVKSYHLLFENMSLLDMKAMPKTEYKFFFLNKRISLIYSRCKPVQKKKLHTFWPTIMQIHVSLLGCLELIAKHNCAIIPWLTVTSRFTVYGIVCTVPKFVENYDTVIDFEHSLLTDL